MSDIKKQISQEMLKHYLSYDPETGIFKWISPPKGRKKILNVTGYLNRGYLKIRIEQRLYSAHRLAWLYVYGEFPKLDIDHIDGNKSNNRIKNWVSGLAC